MKREGVARVRWPRARPQLFARQSRHRRQSIRDASVDRYTVWSDRKRALVLLAPIAVTASMFVIALAATTVFGSQRGMVGAFLTYWFVWGIAFPLWILRAQGVIGLFGPAATQSGITSAAALILLAAPPLIGFLFVFPALFPDAGEGLLLTLAGYATVNGAVEEVFWRGLFIRAFPADRLRGVLYPAVMFALWHVALLVPLAVWTPILLAAAFPVALCLGLIYGWVAWRTNSVRWTAVSHVLTNLSGLGALVVLAM